MDLGDNIKDFINVAFEVYTWLIFARIVLSWIKPNPNNPLIKFIIELTEPFLSIFRRIIPPMGMLDLSPIAAFFALHLLRILIVDVLLNALI
ncbi:MAG: YggT family protein [Firmicutes bacterium]|nr:YggT family protein [Bacillota bacterium]